MAISFIGLGSNIGKPEQQVMRALEKIAGLDATTLLVHSSLYRSKPVGPQDQDDFINAVAKIDTGLSALELLEALQAIEQEHGRKRLRHWGPRTLDLDILAFGHDMIATERFVVPHPEIRRRAFVLLPWVEIAPEWTLPCQSRIETLLNDLDADLPEKLW